MPAIAQGNRAANGALAVATNPDWDVRLLHGLRLEGNVLKAHIMSLKSRACPASTAL